MLPFLPGFEELIRPLHEMTAMVHKPPYGDHTTVLTLGCTGADAPSSASNLRTSPLITNEQSLSPSSISRRRRQDMDALLREG
jgi:hypothetical protein